MHIIKLQAESKALRGKVKVSFSSMLWCAGLFSSKYYHPEAASINFHKNKLYQYRHRIKGIRTEPFRTLLRRHDFIYILHTLIFHIILCLEEQTYLVAHNNCTYCFCWWTKMHSTQLTAYRFFLVFLVLYTMLQKKFLCVIFAYSCKSICREKS